MLRRAGVAAGLRLIERQTAPITVTQERMGRTGRVLDGTRDIPTKKHLIFIKKGQFGYRPAIEEDLAKWQYEGKPELHVPDPDNPHFKPLKIRYEEKFVNWDDSRDLTVGKDEEDILYERLELDVSGMDKAVVRSYSQFVRLAGLYLDVPIDQVTYPPYAIKFWWSHRSAFGHAKRGKVHYEIRTFKCKVKTGPMMGSTANTFLEYIERNLPEGNQMIVRRIVRDRLPSYMTDPEKYRELLKQTKGEEFEEEAVDEEGDESERSFYSKKRPKK